MGGPAKTLPFFRLFMELDIVDGAVQSVRTIVNPDKLQHLGPVSDILRRDSNPES